MGYLKTGLKQSEHTILQQIYNNIVKLYVLERFKLVVSFIGYV